MGRAHGNAELNARSDLANVPDVDIALRPPWIQVRCAHLAPCASLTSVASTIHPCLANPALSLLALRCSLVSAETSAQAKSVKPTYTTIKTLD
eukprot:3262894-Rhodomonas_salina.2